MNESADVCISHRFDMKRTYLEVKQLVQIRLVRGNNQKKGGDRNCRQSVFSIWTNKTNGQFREQLDNCGFHSSTIDCSLNASLPEQAGQQSKEWRQSLKWPR